MFGAATRNRLCDLALGSASLAARFITSLGRSRPRPCHVWAMDISYIPMRRGFVYLAAVVDVLSRRVLVHRVSITLEAEFCVEALEEALAKHGRPEIFNTDQGSQFVSQFVRPYVRYCD
jgi:transposase InsO family protein